MCAVRTATARSRGHNQEGLARIALLSTASHTGADIGTIVPCHTELTTGSAITIYKLGDAEYADCDCRKTKVCGSMNFLSFESGCRQFADAPRK
jgi:hypothetical protein